MALQGAYVVRAGLSFWKNTKPRSGFAGRIDCLENNQGTASLSTVRRFFGRNHTKHAANMQGKFYALRPTLLEIDLEDIWRLTRFGNWSLAQADATTVI